MRCALGYGGLRYRDEHGNVVPLQTPGRWMSFDEREQALHDHPNAYWVLEVPVSAVWDPPAEPRGAGALNWHWDEQRLAEHRERVRKSLEDFVNAKQQGSIGCYAPAGTSSSALA